MNLPFPILLSLGVVCGCQLQGDRLSENVVVVNTHNDENPEFVGKLVDFLAFSGVEPVVAPGYGKRNPLDQNPTHILLTGVPLYVDYSLSEERTQKIVHRAFDWLQDCTCPVMGICYGHQILAEIFGGEVSPLDTTVKAERLHLQWTADHRSGIFSDLEELYVFAEHRDYVSKMPSGFFAPCQMDQIPYIMVQPDRRMYGVQFVPDQSDDRSRQLLRRFVGI
jgi:GMP synthase-like glutamine amidotransferase